VITNQIRWLLLARPFVPFSIALSDGRELNVESTFSLALAGKDEAVAVACPDGCFIIVNPQQIVSVGPRREPKPPDPAAIRKMRQFIGLDPETGNEKTS
jgi:hypothetical protein